MRDMVGIVRIGRVFFALALIGLGVEHFVFREFIVGRAPAWPETWSGGVAWAYLSGTVFVAVGVAALFGKHARLGLIFGAMLILVWALLRHIPLVAGDTLFGPSWTAAGKALTLFGGSLAIAGTFPAPDAVRAGPLSGLIDRPDAFFVMGRVCLAIFLLITGVQHFIYTEFVASLIPGWFPGDAVFWTQFAGVALLAGGVGLSVPKVARTAALLVGLMVFSWFWIVHVPRTFAGVSDSIAVFEALAVSGIAFVLTQGDRKCG